MRSVHSFLAFQIPDPNCPSLLVSAKHHYAAHVITYPSLEHDANWLLGINASPRTASLCPLNVSLHLPPCQSLIVASAEPKTEWMGD